MRARESQQHSIQKPTTTALLCGVSLKSQERSLHYDDIMILSVNKYALIVSNKELLPDLERQGELYIWNFGSVRGQKYNVGSEKPPYCLGGASDCVIPATDKLQPMSFVLGPAAASPLAAKLTNKDIYLIDLTITGDNDGGDCGHSGLTLDVALDYVDK